MIYVIRTSDNIVYLSNNLLPLLKAMTQIILSYIESSLQKCSALFYYRAKIKKSNTKMAETEKISFVSYCRELWLKIIYFH